MTAICISIGLPGQPANGECGGNSYRNGVMLGSTTVVTTPNQPTTTTTTGPTTPVVTTTPSIPVNISNCAELSSPGYHVVQKNETLYGISRLYGVSVNEIVRMNGIPNPNRLSPCTKLRIGNAASTTVVNTGSSSEDWRTTTGVHVVSRGETIYQLAKRYGYTTSRFRAMNGLGVNDPIYIGQSLRTTDCNCPSPANTTVATTQGATTALPVPAEYSATGGRLDTRGESSGVKRKVHIVKDNETVYTIARSYGISVARLRSLNKMEENEVIYPFQRLYIN